MAWTLAKAGAFPPTPALMSLAGRGPDDLAAILKGLGYRAAKDADGRLVFRAAGGKGRKGKRQNAAGGKRREQVAPDSPFAKLKHLTAAR